MSSRDADGRETTQAVVVPMTRTAVDVESLLRHCHERTAAFKRPREIHVLEALPKSISR